MLQTEEKGWKSRSYRWSSWKVLNFHWLECCVQQCSPAHWARGTRSVFSAGVSVLVAIDFQYGVQLHSCIAVNQVWDVSLPLGECVEEKVCSGRGTREGLIEKSLQFSASSRFRLISWDEDGIYCLLPVLCGNSCVTACSIHSLLSSYAQSCLINYFFRGSICKVMLRTT